MLVITRLSKLVALALMAATLSGCAAAMAYRKGFEAAQRRDWDAAVAHYRQAVQEDPDKPEYRIALERAMLEAALIHAFAGKEFEAKGELDAALREFKRASEYEPSNRQLAAKVAELDRVIRETDRGVAPRSRIAEMRDKARRMSPEPLLNPASREPINFKFGPSASVRDILNFIGAAYRHQRHLHRRLSRAARVHGAARRRHARAGASAGAVGQRALLQGAQRAHDPGHPRQRAEPREVRGTGHPHLLPLARRRAGDGAVAQRDRARPGLAHRAGLCRQQEPELRHGARHGAAGRDHGADHRVQRSAARRSDRGRADPRGEPRARQAVRPGAEQLLGHRHLLAGEERRPGDDDGGLADCRRSTSTRSRPASAPPTSTWPCRPPSCDSWRPTRRPSWSPSRSCAVGKAKRSS